MTYTRPVLAAIFDMDGLLIDSEPLWDQAELDVFATLNVDLSRRSELPDTLGLRIDQVVRMWYETLPWSGPSQQEVTDRIIARAINLVEEKKPLLPGVEQALQLCRAQGLKVGLASASPLHMLEKVLTLFNLRDYFDTLASAESLPWSKPHPQVYLDAAAQLGVDPLNCVTLEDSFNGMIATKAARMRSIVVPAEEYRDDPRWALADVKLDSLVALTPQHLKGY
ncbi:MAG: hexitol phosphatase HxpB [Mixta calida]|uniref:hexitol phosphatase HxpB n=1 Tax=Mixta TaxID=2100764 RepID=UPI000536397F|nr:MULTISPECIES: hexitol phosphatase HxpB [Mixta]AIX73907.1 2-deoxyglucose-6-phosphatase [Pantoea sp. PSNIH2]MBS6057721.1 hexitol phosphatase HxpB [Pantoea sp.]POU48879.1 2-deoxyglucose-6-phosphatase [Pantoea sp. PSNIH5]POU67164.1 2-deoxyglucose-6-phosphatase [Pantoea sp. PSNIH4]POY68562.1 2-deoxyglucose-6-phosphatase [Pantoea sp. PSNIH3]HCW48058.1 hexitol phosphatase HxpB [Erwiniaceae bacterium]